MSEIEVDLAAGRTLPGAWTAAWAADPDRTVLSTLDGAAMSAAELAERTAIAAARYAAAGLAPGDRVLISAGPSLDLVVAYVAALRYGLAVVPANTAYTARELAGIAADAAPALAVLDDPARAGELPRVTGPDLAGLPTPAADVALDEAAPRDVALIVYTSGTTGLPKGVPLTHGNLLASAHAVRIAWRWEPDDRLALCLPLFHVHGLGVGLHGTLTAGASALVLPGFDPAGVAAAIRDHRATLFFGVPTMYHRLAESEHLAALAGLRLAVSGSAPLPADLHEAVAAGSGQHVLERYGMTETIMLVSNPYDGERRPGTVGFPLPGVAVRLAPRPGGTAEIEVAGPNVIAGYRNRPDADAAAFAPDGWFRTGDLGVLDPDGYLRISGRAKELIITGGYNVYPREVEEVLRAHPGVADAAVVGAASAEWGETVAAFVVAGDAVDAATLERDLVAWCADRLAPYKRPRLWRWIDAVPRNALGKILRHELVA
ncbi:AMP-binding protein [Planosporangium thailandense]|uniref:AMP-binding protein n=2 Tax=Planosporangium thailandense TaxID=765197 RepID=A0ABX0Y134_9ACTN|nr:AMP-binding protein [Planosporangium thailandense]NJC71290.1 AMP-binding protein [Planosporangium thailandense]